jgi:hypothetical protein
MPKWEPVIGERAEAWEGTVVKGVGAVAEEGEEVLGTTEDGVPEEVVLAGRPEGLVVPEEEALAAAPEEFAGLLEGEDIRGRRRKRKRLRRWSDGRRGRGIDRIEDVMGSAEPKKEIRNSMKKGWGKRKNWG